MKNYETMSVELVKFESREKVMINNPDGAPEPVRSGAAPVAPGTAAGPIT